MIHLIYGAKGSGKTKRIIDMANASIDTTTGDIVFITDTNPDHLDRILSGTSGEYRIFMVEEGEVKMINDKY